LVRTPAAADSNVETEKNKEKPEVWQGFGVLANCAGFVTVPS
jgi:hypothetical protein